VTRFFHVSSRLDGLKQKARQFFAGGLQFRLEKFSSMPIALRNAFATDGKVSRAGYQSARPIL
jgi:hypothetical protein